MYRHQFLWTSRCHGHQWRGDPAKLSPENCNVAFVFHIKILESIYLKNQVVNYLLKKVFIFFIIELVHLFQSGEGKREMLKTPRMCAGVGVGTTPNTIHPPSSLGRLGKDLQGKLNTSRQLILHIWHSAWRTHVSWGDLQKCGGRDFIARDHHYQALSALRLSSEARCVSKADRQRSLLSSLVSEPSV